jgi:hypothetical protein
MMQSFRHFFLMDTPSTNKTNGFIPYHLIISKHKYYGVKIFIIYLVVVMQNLHGVIMATSQSPISERRAKNVYQYIHFQFDPLIKSTNSFLLPNAYKNS